jgi:nucleotide-binding universal stress UspA family protein
MAQPTLLCPVDFSESSRGALRYAVAIAEHFGAKLILLSVSDPVLAEAASLQVDERWLTEQVNHDVERFLAQAVPGMTPSDVVVRIVTGKPATEILRWAQTEGADLIVMSSRGNSGVRKLFFGATTERVLRETEVPVLVTPADDKGPENIEQLRGRIQRVLAPLDDMGATSPQLEVARAIADALGSRLLLVHVVEPLWFPTMARPRLSVSDRERQHRAEQFLIAASGAVPSDRKVEILTAFGDPAEEIAKIATDRGVGLVVIGLHASPKSGPRMGSVTYRVLCLAPTLVLALPPTAVPGAKAELASTSASAPS